MRFSVFKLKKDKVEEWKAWGKYLEEHKDEVLVTLQEEQVDIEFSVIFEIDGEPYTTIVMLGDDIQPSTERELNLMHRAKISECVEGRIAKGEKVYLSKR